MAAGGGRNENGESTADLDRWLLSSGGKAWNLQVPAAKKRLRIS